ncbi:MAG: hypothetical protein QOF14_5778 [Hyphomicrobiales bacterium]|jgi:hypothetical protein|nr:hypothetical protein [Bradyrhizobium sp.]MEA2880582.1 hypothetical protein [Hyphomicrobiales bacterium]
MIIDTNISCLNKSQFLKGKGVTAVGRYYREATHPTWKITKAEAQELSLAAIKIFMVFEDFGKAADLKLTRNQGKADGQSALGQATAIGQPLGTTIYFAVEGLPNGYKSADLPKIKDYFDGVKDAIGAKYALGVYGDGVVCKTFVNDGTCKHSWLAAASCSFEGTCLFFAKGLFTLAQLPPLNLSTGWNGLSVDINHLNPNISDFGAFQVP